MPILARHVPKNVPWIKYLIWISIDNINGAVAAFTTSAAAILYVDLYFTMGKHDMYTYIK